VRAPVRNEVCTEKVVIFVATLFGFGLMVRGISGADDQRLRVYRLWYVESPDTFSYGLGMTILGFLMILGSYIAYRVIFGEFWRRD